MFLRGKEKRNIKSFIYEDIQSKSFDRFPFFFFFFIDIHTYVSNTYGEAFKAESHRTRQPTAR